VEGSPYDSTRDLRLAAGRDLLCRMGGRLVSEGLSLSDLRLADGERQLPCGEDCRKYVVRLDSGSAIHCTVRKDGYRNPGHHAAKKNGQMRSDGIASLVCPVLNEPELQPRISFVFGSSYCSSPMRSVSKKAILPLSTPGSDCVSVLKHPLEKHLSQTWSTYGSK
jgi:hypothetical protein